MNHEGGSGKTWVLNGIAVANNVVFGPAVANNFVLPPVPLYPVPRAIVLVVLLCGSHDQETDL